MDIQESYESIIYGIQVCDQLLQDFVVQKDTKSEVRPNNSNDNNQSNSCEQLCAVQVALQAAEETIRHQMIVSPGSNFGIILYGVQGAPKQCLNLIEFGVQDSLAVKRIMQLARNKEELHNQIKAASEPTSLSDLFHLISISFERAPLKKVRRLILVTKDDLSDVLPTVRDAAKTRLRDLVEKNVSIQPVFIQLPAPEPQFNPGHFWSDVYLSPLEQDKNSGRPLPEPVQPHQIKAVVLGRSLSRGAVTRLKLQLTNVSIDICAYRLFVRRKLPTPRKVSSLNDEQKLVTTKTRYIVEKTGKEVSRENLSRGFKFGSDTFVPVSNEKLAELHDFGEPVVAIKDFRRRSSLMNMGSIAPSVMLYPTDVLQENALEAFSAIHQCMLENDLIATASAIFRKSSAPVLGVLFATKARAFTDSGLPNMPSALHFVSIPYVDDLRALPPIQKFDVSENEELIDCIGDVVDELTMKAPFNPRKYMNPRLLWFDEIIEATALSTDLPKEPQDTTKPSYRSINTRAGPAIVRFNELLDKLPLKDCSETLVEAQGKRARLE